MQAQRHSGGAKKEQGICAAPLSQRVSMVIQFPHHQLSFLSLFHASCVRFPCHALHARGRHGCSTDGQRKATAAKQGSRQSAQWGLEHSGVSHTEAATSVVPHSPSPCISPFIVHACAVASVRVGGKKNQAKGPKTEPAAQHAWPTSQLPHPTPLAISFASLIYNSSAVEY